jgi:hypothetical protein
MIDRDPIDLRAEVRFHLHHQRTRGLRDAGAG